MTKPNKNSALWQTLSDAESESLSGGVGLLLPAVQAAREASEGSDRKKNSGSRPIIIAYIIL